MTTMSLDNIDRGFYFSIQDYIITTTVHELQLYHAIVKRLKTEADFLNVNFIKNISSLPTFEKLSLSMLKQTKILIFLYFYFPPTSSIFCLCFQGLPKDAPYRVNVETLYNHRLKLCETHGDVAKVESALGLGNIEEVIAMGYDELGLIPKYIELKMHEK
jgi:hypothetical protein